MGLGPVEFWGALSTHDEWDYQCPYCEEALTTGYSDPQQEREEVMADWRCEEAKYEKLGI